METRRFVSVLELARLVVRSDFDDPLLLVFKMVSDNGSNIKSAWHDGERWVPCVDHTLELCTLPITWVKKHATGHEAVRSGSIAEAYAHGRGIVGFLHVSPKAEADFHKAQDAHDLAQTKIDLDVRTRWRTAHDMGDQLQHNKPAILEMDKNPSYKDPGETWGKNKISMAMWDFIEEGTAVLDPTAMASQFLEGDKYVTSSLVVPMTFGLMATSSPLADVKFKNRAADEFNDSDLNPVKVPHDQLTEKMQEARKSYHERLIKYFDSDVSIDVQKFWFIASMLDVRFKKLTFKNDRMITVRMRREAVKWLTEEFNRKYKGKAEKPVSSKSETFDTPYVKRRKTSAQAFFDDSDDSMEEEEEEESKDELEAYLALPQVKCSTEKEALDWWRDHADEFPNLSVMARQYLGCPASSAAVERLFSQVGIAFSKKRQSAGADTVAEMMFARCNLP
jgi:hypothetical protein